MASFVYQAGVSYPNTRVLETAAWRRAREVGTTISVKFFLGKTTDEWWFDGTNPSPTHYYAGMEKYKVAYEDGDRLLYTAEQLNDLASNSRLQIIARV